MHAVPRGHGLAGARLQRLARGEGQAGDVDLLANVANGIGGNTICALGDAAAWPMLGFLTKFRADFEARMNQGTAAKARAVAARRRRDARRRRGVNIAGAEPGLGDQILFYGLARVRDVRRDLRHHAQEPDRRAVMGWWRRSSAWRPST